MKRTVEEWLLNPPPGTAAAAARDFGIDLTLLIRRLRLSPEERLDELQRVIDDIEEARASLRAESREMNDQAVGDLTTTRP